MILVKPGLIDRIVLLSTGVVASFQVVSGLNHFSDLTALYYTIAFGILIIACILLILFGFDILENKAVVVISSFIPLFISLGLVNSYLPDYHCLYLIFSVCGLIFIIMTRFSKQKLFSILSIILVHGIAGLLIFILPLVLSIKGVVKPAFLLIGLGGGLIGLGGIALAFLRSGSSMISKKVILKLTPFILFSVTLLISIGLSV
jgi:hypothetical protein